MPSDAMIALKGAITKSRVANPISGAHALIEKACRQHAVKPQVRYSPFRVARACQSNQLGESVIGDIAVLVKEKLLCQRRRQLRAARRKFPFMCVRLQANVNKTLFTADHDYAQSIPNDRSICCYGHSGVRSPLVRPLAEPSVGAKLPSRLGQKVALHKRTRYRQRPPRRQ